MDDQEPKKYDLDDLKRQVDQEIKPLINYLESPVDRCNAYLSLLRDNWDDKLAYEIFNEAKKIETPVDKYYCLQSLSSEIYFHNSENSSSNASTGE